jgi:ADP-ribose pyrophosphatase YjhB (NUDIX family)
MARYHRILGNAYRTYRRMRGGQTLGVRGLVLDGQDRVALIMHTYIDRWHLPGGGVKRNETFRQAMIRELSEEIGVTDVRVERILGIYHNTTDLKDDHVVVFVARTTADRVELRPPDSFEIQEARWFSLDALPGDISPATARRIGEYRTSQTVSADW